MKLLKFSPSLTIWKVQYMFCIESNYTSLNFVGLPKNIIICFRCKMDKYLKLTNLDVHCSTCSCRLNSSNIVEGYDNKKLVLLVRLNDATAIFLNTIKNAVKRAGIDMMETKSNCVILGSNQNLTEEIYNTLKQNIQDIPKTEYELIIESVNIAENGIVFVKIKITNLRNIIAKVSPNLVLADPEISSTIYIGKIKESQIEKFKLVIVEKNLNYKFPLHASNFGINFNLADHKYEVFFSDSPEKMALTPNWRQLTT